MYNTDTTVVRYRSELDRILQYWSTVAFDSAKGRFYGKVNNDNGVDPDAMLGSVLYARILWSFSAGYHLTKDENYLPYAKIAFDYIADQFWDNEFGGVYWTIDAQEQPADDKKQIYALAFAMYGCTEYYRITNNKKALDRSIELFNLIEKYSFDAEKGGYLEAFSRNWGDAGDLRLSAKDENEKKTMNTHLHVLEAYTNLYRIWPAKKVAVQIQNLLNVFFDHIIDAKTSHLLLFFDENWVSKTDLISYGHDIEASWLLLEAAEVLGDESLIAKAKEYSIKMAVAAAEGLEKDGSLNYEFEPKSNHLIAEKHWWVQAEAVVGFMNAWQLSGNSEFLTYVNNSWSFIDQYILDKQNGEWFWGVNDDYSLMLGEDKAGLWKCPYHNSRACMEMILRFTKCYNVVN
ncbi:N-acyl-D-glucosamine 2-epimerase [Solitalea longa]|uniref:Cellobiose 2-epimerase n=1 Tax=Solitalea longa TaxID=2079460 RepID=A0A2S5A265_9SPHI|nr:AGE family epimerase/isomerase [Solitalea longa]POY36645.1 N-acyl-D-glucosamine 2-epimerase [Solitalea longa]